MRTRARRSSEVKVQAPKDSSVCVWVTGEMREEVKERKKERENKKKEWGRAAQILTGLEQVIRRTNCAMSRCWGYGGLSAGLFWELSSRSRLAATFAWEWQAILEEGFACNCCQSAVCLLASLPVWQSLAASRHVEIPGQGTLLQAALLSPVTLFRLVPVIAAGTNIGRAFSSFRSRVDTLMFLPSSFTHVAFIVMTFILFSIFTPEFCLRFNMATRPDQCGNKICKNNLLWIINKEKAWLIHNSVILIFGFVCDSLELLTKFKILC